MQERRSDSNLETAMEKVVEFIRGTSGLDCQVLETGNIEISQKLDGKRILLNEENIISVIPRLDHKDDPFIQVNFLDGRKILLTDQLIGFKPVLIEGINTENLPKVVATPDLIGLFEAMEDCLDGRVENFPTILELRQAFLAIVEGGEAIGIDLAQEKLWLKHISIKRSIGDC